MRKNKVVTIPNYTYEPTSNPNIQRFCDMKGDWQYYWLVKEKRFVKAVNYVLELGHSKGPAFKAYLLRTNPEESKKLLDEKGDEGSRTHKAINDLLMGLKVTMATKYPTELHDGRQTILTGDEWDNLLGFVNWAERYQPRIVAIEEPLVGEDYAGTMDALLVITIPAGDKDFEKSFWGKDVLVLVDWKTSGKIWFEYEAQTSAYFKSAKVDPRYVKFFKAYDGRLFTAVVRIGTSHGKKFEFIWWSQKTTEGEHWDRFKAAQLIANRYEKDFTPEIVHIPTQLFIKAPRAKVVAKKQAKIKR